MLILLKKISFPRTTQEAVWAVVEPKINEQMGSAILERNPSENISAKTKEIPSYLTKSKLVASTLYRLISYCESFLTF